MMRKIGSIVLSGLLAFVCLSMFTSLYYNLPVHVESETNSTDYVWEKNKWQSRGTEGFAHGRLDAKGFNNASVIDDVGILIMGSSQMEAFNVSQDENTTSVLNKLLAENRMDLLAYNIGISGHTLLACVNNLPNAVEEFSPSHYVVIETMAYKFDTDQMCRVMEGTLARTGTHSGGFLTFLQRFSYLRLLYKQVDGYLEEQSKDTGMESEEARPKANLDEYKTILDRFLHQAVGRLPKGCKLIILVDRPLELDRNNDVIDHRKNEYYAALTEACENNDIILVDMHEAFSQSYITEKRFPNGFSNTRVGQGHLNKYGHALIAKELLDIILQGE